MDERNNKSDSADGTGSPAPGRIGSANRLRPSGSSGSKQVHQVLEERAAKQKEKLKEKEATATAAPAE